MKTTILAIALLSTAAFVGCTTAPAVPTPTQQTIAAAVEDSLSIGLVPVLTKNASYLPIAQGVSAALGSFTGTTLTPEDVSAFLAKTKLAPDDARTIAALVNAAWATYARRYQAAAGASLRPDVRLFLGAVSTGINNAIAAVPKA